MITILQPDRRQPFFNDKHKYAFLDVLYLSPSISDSLATINEFSLFNLHVGLVHVLKYFE